MTNLLVSPDEFIYTITMKDKERRIEKKRDLPLKPLKTPLPNIFEKGEIETIFTPEEISHIKLTILTGINPKEKIEAIRKLFYAPIDIEEKGVLYLKALSDESPQVRKEGVSLLYGVGLNKELGETLSSMVDAEPAEKELAIEKVKTFIDKSSVSEKMLTCIFLISCLKFEKMPKIEAIVIRELANFAKIIVEREELLSSLIKTIINAMARNFDELRVAVLLLFEKITSYATKGTSEIVWKEILGIDNLVIKSFFFNIIVRLKPSSTLAKTLARIAVKELLIEDAKCLDIRKVADSLLIIPNDALEAIFEEIPSIDKDKLAYLITIIDTLAINPNTSDQLRQKAGKLFVKFLKDEGRLIRTKIIEARVCYHELLPEVIKEELAGDFINNLHNYKAERIYDGTTAVIKKIGPPAIDILILTIKNSPYPIERETSAKLITEIVLSNKISADKIEKLITFFKSCEDTENLPTGLVVRCIGRLCLADNIKPNRVKETYLDYKNRLGKVSYNFALIDSLSWIGSSNLLEQQLCIDWALRLLEFLEKEPPELVFSERRTDEGILLDLGRQTTIYTDLIPDMISGLERIYLANRLTQTVKETIIDGIIKLWSRVVNCETIWAPGNIVQLAKMMGKIANSDFTNIDLKVKIISALTSSIENIQIVEILGNTCWTNKDVDNRYLELTKGIVEKFIAMLGHPDYSEEGDKRVIACALATIAKNPQLSPSRRESDILKKRVYDLLKEMNIQFAKK
jgi:hypothetical protein